MNTFSIENDTHTADQFTFSGRQAEKFAEHNCERAFRWRYVAGDVRNLPKYVTASIRAAGYEPVHLGGTTYRCSVIGLRRVLRKAI